MHKISTQTIAMHKRSHKALEQTLGATVVALQAIHIGSRSRGGTMFGNWMRMANDAVMLGFEMQRVIGLRLLKLSRGGRAAEVEALRMVTEKTTALAEAGMTLARGGSAGTIIRRYRTHVRANKGRLSKS
jgi:hypothetical protein